MTDIKTENAGVLEQVEAACRGGADLIQLRSKTLTDSELCRLGLKMREITERQRKLFFVNDRPDIAILVSADGVHLGQDDLPLTEVRTLFKRAGIFARIGKSTHQMDQALAAEKEGADYIGVGPVFATPTKPHYQPAGLEFVKQASLAVSIPVVAIGGIDEKNVDLVLNAGAKRIAVVRALFSSPDVCQAARSLKGHIENFQHAN